MPHILSQFLPSNYQDQLRRRLRDLQQGTGSVHVYTAAFMHLLTQLPDMSEPAAVFAYVSGLAPAVRDVVSIHKHSCYQMAAAMAARVACQRESSRTPLSLAPSHGYPAPLPELSTSTDMELGAVHVARPPPVFGDRRVCQRCLQPGPVSIFCPATTPAASVLAAVREPRS